MNLLLSKIYVWWMSIESSKQYLYCLVSLSCLLFLSMILTGLLLTLNIINIQWGLPFFTLGILIFSLIFFSLVGFLNMYYPDYLKKGGNHEKNHN